MDWETWVYICLLSPLKAVRMMAVVLLKKYWHLLSSFTQKGCSKASFRSTHGCYGSPSNVFTHFNLLGKVKLNMKCKTKRYLILLMVLVMSYKTSENNGASSLFLLDPKPNCETLGLVTCDLLLATFNSLLLKCKKLSTNHARPHGWSSIALGEWTILIQISDPSETHRK